MVGAVISANPLQLDIRSHRKCLAICFVVTVSSFQYGLDYALVGGFMAMPGFLKVFGYYDEATSKWAIDPTVQQLISSLMTIGTFVGSLSVGPFSSKLGRRNGLWAASILNYIATAIMIGTTNIGALYLARFILGISVGWFLTFAQVYINEVAPAHLRGIVFAVYQTQLCIGSIVGAAIDNGTHAMLGKGAYQIPLAVFFIAPTIQTVSLFFFPESPRWLMTHGREAAAESALRQLRNRNIRETEFRAEFEEIRVSTVEQSNHLKGKHLWIEMWKGTNRRRSILSIAVICFHCANGSSWLNIYTTYFLTVAGVKEAFALSTMITCMGLVGVLASISIVLYVGRRVMLLIGVGACGFCQLAFAIAWTVAPGTEATAKSVVAFIALFTFFYVAYAPYAWLLGGELPSNHLRAHTYGVGTALNFLGNWLGVFTAPYFINPASLGWNAKYGYIWFVSNMIVFTFTWAFIPETRDRTLEEINEIFESKVPARKFKEYICVGTEVSKEAATNKMDVSIDHVEGRPKGPA
ncbi:general substrate transporter [Annulohypoxylon maeteangense]|uniref:general substrate transporter n=1 Tax=Annulohypoxylon maeteangense TaxID=1927788 RepID=UPI0020078CCE|nr:general substrate transporter [Annulohypoxylon maeteangense]KAI0880607.1 general substrate transporter [Annulohypoxylon maeteangense]